MESTQKVWMNLEIHDKLNRDHDVLWGYRNAEKYK